MDNAVNNRHKDSLAVIAPLEVEFFDIGVIRKQVLKEGIDARLKTRRGFMYGRTRLLVFVDLAFEDVDDFIREVRG